MTKDVVRTTTSVKVPNEDLTSKILKMEDYILREFDPVEIEWIHRFTPGMYSREMIVDEYTLVTGAIHKTEHISIFLEGAMMVPSEEGGDYEIIEAPFIEICQPGVKRAGISLEKCRWVTFHPTDEQNVEKCEELFFTNDPKEVPLVEQQGFSLKQKDFALAQRAPALPESKRELLK